MQNNSFIEILENAFKFSRLDHFTGSLMKTRRDPIMITSSYWIFQQTHIK